MHPNNMSKNREGGNSSAGHTLSVRQGKEGEVNPKGSFAWIPNLTYNPKRVLSSGRYLGGQDVGLRLESNSQNSGACLGCAY